MPCCFPCRRQYIFSLHPAVQHRRRSFIQRPRAMLCDRAKLLPARASLLRLPPCWKLPRSSPVRDHLLPQRFILFLLVFHVWKLKKKGEGSSTLPLPARTEAQGPRLRNSPFTHLHHRLGSYQARHGSTPYHSRSLFRTSCNSGVTRRYEFFPILMVGRLARSSGGEGRRFSLPEVPRPG